VPCNSVKLTPEQIAAREERLRDLERQIQRGQVKVRLSAAGRATFEGWETDRTGPGHWHDDCAYRTLTAQGSTVLRQALARGQTRVTRETRRMAR
jgi:hypothetical protein